jgi:copper(I)-binding protein
LLALLALTAACNETSARSAEPEPTVAAGVAPAASPGNVVARADGGDLAVSDAFIQITPKPTLAVAYLTLRKAGQEEETLRRVVGDVAERIELHESLMQDGIMRMVAHPEGFGVPAGGELRLERGGKHVMLIGLKEPLKAGTKVPLKLALSGGREIDVQFPVRDSMRPGDGK